MSKTRKKKRKKTNILLGFVCILLAVLLGFILVTNYKTEQEESKHLSEIAGAQQNGIEDYEAVKKHAEELEKTAPEDTEDTDDSKSKNDKEKSAETEADTDNKENTDQAEDTTKETAAASGIVCWGDDLINGEESATYSYMAVLQKLLTDNGYNLPVINKTLQGGGTLSMMKMAGVSDETLQGYITKHQQAANGAQLNVTETGIRDLTEEQTTRFLISIHNSMKNTMLMLHQRKQLCGSNVNQEKPWKLTGSAIHLKCMMLPAAVKYRHTFLLLSFHVVYTDMQKLFQI